MKRFSIFINGERVINFDEEWSVVLFKAEGDEGGIVVGVNCDGFEKFTKIDLRNIESLEISLESMENKQ